MKNKTLGQRIKKIRLHQKISQKNLAKSAGVTQQCISEIEHSLNDNTKHLSKIAQALGVSQAYLLGESELGSCLTNLTETAHKIFIPILKEHEIIAWVKKHTLPKNCRSIEMSELSLDFNKNKQICLVDITDDAFVDDFFKIKLPNKSIFAIVDSGNSPRPYDIVIAQMPNGKVEIRQYIKSGNEFFLRSFGVLAEKISTGNVKISGIINGYIHTNIDNKSASDK